VGGEKKKIKGIETEEESSSLRQCLVGGKVRVGLL
jgi:hypothetical protein